MRSIPFLVVLLLLAASLSERAGLLREAMAELPERWRRLLELRLQ